MADSIIAICGKDFVLIGADSVQTRSIMVIKEAGEDKIMHLDAFKLLACSGDNGDRVAFTEYIQKNVKLYELRNDIILNTHETAHFTRRELANALRSQPYAANLLLGGYDINTGTASLYFIDYLASMQKLPFGCQGYAGHFLLGFLDKAYRPDMTVDEARALLDKCIQQLQVRFVLGTPKFTIKLVDKNGITTLSDGK